MVGDQAITEITNGHDLSRRAKLNVNSSRPLVFKHHKEPRLYDDGIFYERNLESWGQGLHIPVGL